MKELSHADGYFYFRDKRYWIDPLLKQICDSQKEKVMKTDDSNTFLICGKKGSGKTTIGSYIAAYLDPDFNGDKVFYNPDRLIHYAERGSFSKDKGRGRVLLFDECMGYLSGRRSSTSVSQRFFTWLSEMRSLNIHLIFIMPSMKSFSRHIVEEDTDYFILTNKNKIGYGNKKKWNYCATLFTPKAKVAYYNFLKTGKLIKKGRKGSIDFRKKPILSIEEYNIKKQQNRIQEWQNSLLTEKGRTNKTGVVWRDRVGTLLKLLIDELGLTHKQLSQVLEFEGVKLSRVMITTLLNEKEAVNRAKKGDLGNFVTEPDNTLYTISGLAGADAQKEKGG